MEPPSGDLRAADNSGCRSPVSASTSDARGNRPDVNLSSQSDYNIASVKVPVGCWLRRPATNESGESSRRDRERRFRWSSCDRQDCDYHEPPLPRPGSLLPTRVLLVRKTIRSQDTTDNEALDNEPGVETRLHCRVDGGGAIDAGGADHNLAPRMRRSGGAETPVRGRDANHRAELEPASECIGDQKVIVDESGQPCGRCDDEPRNQHPAPGRPEADQSSELVELCGERVTPSEEKRQLLVATELSWKAKTKRIIGSLLGGAPPSGHANETTIIGSCANDQRGASAGRTLRRFVASVRDQSANFTAKFSGHQGVGLSSGANKSQLRPRHRNESLTVQFHVSSCRHNESNVSESVDVARRTTSGNCAMSQPADTGAYSKTTTPNCYNRCSRDLDDRRSTYCSSLGATDPNFDSSISSGVIQNMTTTTTSNTNTSKGGHKMRDSRGSTALDDGETIANEFTKTPRLPFGKSCKIKMDIKSLKQLQPIKARENWDKNIEFLLAVIGFAVDLGNVWRFPYICYKNGGGAFLIPYTLLFISSGLPIFYLEMSLGQYFSSGCLTIWKGICPMAKGIGYAMCVLNFFTSLYYNTIISWAVFFFVESFASVLPWTSCNGTWSSSDCRTLEQRQAMRLNMTQNVVNDVTAHHFSSPTKDYFEREVLRSQYSGGIHQLGDIRKPLAIYLAIVFICIYFAIWKGVKSTGKAVWITALLPYFVLIPLLIRGVLLEGAWLGIKYYLYPNWSAIADVDVWVEAAKQIYFSLGPGFGTLMALSSYNKFNHNCQRDALIAASVNYFASFIAGLVIFAVLGYMATIENVSINDVATEGPGLVFQVYPEGLATMRFSPMWSVFFFIMVITLGIDSTFGGLESVITGLCDEYPRLLRAHRGVFIGLLLIVIYLCSLPTTTYGGHYVIYVLESYGTSLSLLFIVMIETVIVCWLYGADKFCKNLEEMHGNKPAAYWQICWKYITPTILLLIFVAACNQELDKYHTLRYGAYTYPGWAPTLGLLMTGSSLCCVPIYAIYHLKTKTSGTILERLKMASRPMPDEYADEKGDPKSKIRDGNVVNQDTVI